MANITAANDDEPFMATENTQGTTRDSILVLHLGVSVLSLKNHTVSAPRPENSMGYKSITKSSVTRHAVVRAASKLMQNQSVASSPQRGFGLTVWIFTKNPGTPKAMIIRHVIA